MIRYAAVIASLLTLIVVPAAAAQRGPASVFAEPVTEQPFAMEIEALGTLTPNEQVDLTLNTADRVRAIYFDDGQRVAKGKTLLTLAQTEQAALVEGADATAEEARQALERVKKLRESDLIAQTAVDEAQRNLENASAQLRAVQSRQRDRVLVAPFDGVLGFRQVSVGSFVRAGDVVATLIDDSEMNLDFSVPSTFLRALQPGTEIRAVSDDLPGEIFTGTVATLDNRIDPVTRAVRVRATLPNPDLTLRSGMFMQVTVIADPRTAPSIPEEAIEPVGPKTFVFVVDESGDAPIATRVEVSLGMRQAGRVEVLDGVRPGDLIITEGLIRVREGAEIILRDKSMLLPKAGANMGGSGGGSAPGAASPGR